MCSFSDRKLLCLFSMCTGFALKLKEIHPNNQEVCLMSKELYEESKKAYRYFSYNFGIDDKVRKSLFDMLYKYNNITDDKQTPPKKINSTVVTTSTILGIIANNSETIKDEIKLGAIDTMNALMNKIHFYFDRNGRKYLEYTLATGNLKAWEELY